MKPKHYEFLGVVAKVWSDKFGVIIENGELRVGEKVAVEFPIHFHEIEIGSLQVDDKSVDLAKEGQPVGLLWSNLLPRIREGMRVFRVNVPTRLS